MQRLQIGTLLLVLLLTTTTWGQGNGNLLVINNESAVNTDALEFSPAFYKDGIVYLSTRSGSFRFKVTDELIDENIMTLYRSRRDKEGGLQKGEPFATDLLIRAHQGPLTFDRTGKTMFYTRNAEKGKQTTAADGLRKLQIYEARLEDGEWKEGVRLSFNDYSFNTLHPSINADGDKLYFTSDRPGGQGGMDLWVVKRIGEDWGEPLNLGAAVNTADNDVFPFIHADGSLYFASDRTDGVGGLDLYHSEKNSKQHWKRPRNMGNGFNTSADDFGLVMDRDGRNGYFSSNRPGGSGADDIYQFNRGQNRALAALDDRTATVLVWDQDGQKVKGATVAALNLDQIVLPDADGDAPTVLDPRGDRFETLTAGSAQLSLPTNEKGEAALTLRDGRYLITVTQPGYLTQQLLIRPDTDWDNIRVVLAPANDCVQLTGKVLTPNGPYAKAQVYVIDSETLTEEIVYSDAAGNYSTCLPCGKTYTVYATDKGVHSPSAVASADCRTGEPLSLQLRLPTEPVPFRTDDVVTLSNIYFNFDDATLRPDAYGDLDAVKRLLDRFPDMRIELASHTDARGEADYNLRLSQRRSNSVLDYLLGQGVAMGRVDPVGYGETKILNRCRDGVRCSEAEHQLNRRTEFRVLAVDGALSATTSYPTPGRTVPVAPAQPVLAPNPAAPAEREAATTAPEVPGRAVLVTERETVPAYPNNRVIENPDPVAADEYVSSAQGRYTVIAGTFSVAKNADKRLRQLQEAGYPDVRIVPAGTGLRAVEVARFESARAAQLLEQELESTLGIRAAVRD